MTEFAFDEGEVLEHKESGDICHVTHRWVDEDGDVLYAIHDKTHTGRRYYREEDAEEVFDRTSIVVKHGRKPVQAIPEIARKWNIGEVQDRDE